MQVIHVTQQLEGQRLDKFIGKVMPCAPKSFIYKMLRKKNIVLNGRKADGTEKVEEGDEVRLFLSDDTIKTFRKKDKPAVIMPFKLDIVYEDDEIIVINKPAGMLSQKAYKDDISVVEYINEHIKQERRDMGGGTGASSMFSAGVCNRLDMNTSGLIVAGKTIKSLQWLGSVFRQRELEKYYLCIVKGRVEKAARLDGYLVKHGNHNNVTITEHEAEDSSEIITEYEPLQHGRLGSEIYTLLKVRLITGKPHQIRAHLKSAGYPVAGDAKYGYKDVYRDFKRRFGLKHQLLHAWRLEFGGGGSVPGKYRGMVFEAPLPGKFAEIMGGLGMNTAAFKVRTGEEK